MLLITYDDVFLMFHLMIIEFMYLFLGQKINILFLKSLVIKQVLQKHMGHDLKDSKPLIERNKLAMCPANKVTLLFRSLSPCSNGSLKRVVPLYLHNVVCIHF